MLPIAGVFDYLTHHGIDIETTPWKMTSLIALNQAQQLPVDTHVPYSAWRQYLITLLAFLHGLMNDEATAYNLLHHHYRVLEESTLTEHDAENFLAIHFPNER